jgi:acyl-coenzyme A synthetase/AMP-(fatty) acid ligase
LPGVRDVAVFALTASGAEQVCAALVLDAGADVARIRTEAAARLGDQAPARLFVIDKLPRNANGKLMRRELVAMAERSVQR